MDVVEILSRAHVKSLFVGFNTWSHTGNRPRHHFANISNTIRRVWFTPTLILNALRQSLQAIGHTTLGIHPQDIDARSLRAGGATALLCANIDHNTIQLLGRWKSDAIIRYLDIAANPQVHQHAHKMFTNGQASFAPPASQLIQPTPTPEHFLLHGEEFLMLQAKQSPLHATQASQPCPPTASFFSHNGPLGRVGENQDQWESEKLGSYKQ